MSEEDNEAIKKFLGEIDAFQLGRPNPFGTIYWGGLSLANTVKMDEIRKAVLLRTFRPVVTSYHWNITQDRISTGGTDALDEFWFQLAGTIAPFVAAVNEWIAYQAEMDDFIGQGNSTDAYTIVTDTSVDVVSDATHTLIPPANHAYKVTLASIRNNTRAPTGSIAYTPNGGTASILGPVQGTQTATLVLLGGSCINVDLAAILQGIKGPLWMQVGDTLEISNDNFVAADVVRKEFIFEDYTVT